MAAGNVGSVVELMIEEDEMRLIGVNIGHRGDLTMGKTKIEWTDFSFNPWVGCTKVGPGCDNCYAEHLMDTRLHRVRWGTSNKRSRTTPANWRKPLAWNKIESERRQRVFCASLADVFDNEVPLAWRNDLFRLIDATPNLDWLLLTKRIGNVQSMLEASYLQDVLPSNVWLGITVVTQEEANRDIPKLLQLPIPPAVRFLSCEPLLESVNIEVIAPPSKQLGDVRLYSHPLSGPDKLNWVICGGESGPKARPMNISWALDIRNQCLGAGVPFFMKQGSQANWPDWKDIDRWIQPLQVREYP